MSAAENTPSNKNFLSPLNFQFQIKKTPYTNFFIQKVNIPSMALQASETPTPFVKTPAPGDHINFGTLEITFKVDEDLQNYLELFNWMTHLGFDQNFNQYYDIEKQSPTSGNGIYSDISVTALTSSHQPNYVISYIDAFPVNLGAITFNTTDPNINYIECSATFKYTYFTVEQINSINVSIVGNTG